MTKEAGLIRVQVRYRGRVQGVGFRASARSIAQGEPTVSGWVRNEPDGSVLMEAQGTDAAVRAVLQRLRYAMGRNIESVQESPSPVVAGERGFVIAR
jgi:acylphosphatase